MDGPRRSLTGMTADGPKIKSFEPGHLEAIMDQGKSVWRQYLNFTEVNGVPYFDEGNGAVVPIIILPSLVCEGLELSRSKTGNISAGIFLAKAIVHGRMPLNESRS